MAQAGIQKLYSVVLEKAFAEHCLSRQEVKYLLQSAKGSETDSLFQTARKLRQRYFRNQVFLYRFVYNSTRLMSIRLSRIHRLKIIKDILVVWRGDFSIISGKIRDVQ